MRIARHQRSFREPPFCWRGVLRIALALVCLGSGFVARASEASREARPARNLPPHAASQFALADFDGDSRPDLATIEVGPGTPLHTHYWVAFQLSSGSRSALGITAPTGGLQITSRDVNGDDFPDVIITTAWTNRPVAVLLNDGLGNFTESSPGAFPAAFSDPEVFLLCSSPAIQDSSIGFSPRYPSGECDHFAAEAVPHDATTLLYPEVLPGTLRVPAASFLGRAPPVCALPS